MYDIIKINMIQFLSGNDREKNNAEWWLEGKAEKTKKRMWNDLVIELAEEKDNLEILDALEWEQFAA